MILKKALNQATALLKSRSDAFLVSEVLLAHVLGKSKEHLLAHPEEELSDIQEKDFFLKLDRVLDGFPLAYIIHEKEFFGLNFFVDERVLIPRPETELLVEEVLKICAADSSVKTIADIGTGSGCIAVALREHLPAKNNVRIFASDISDDALEVARENVRRHGFDCGENPIEIFQGDLLEPFLNGKFFLNGGIDLVVGNLPYIGKERFRFVSEEVERTEPHTALFGGSDGLQLYKKMFQQIMKMRNLPKYILGEFGFSQGEELRILLNQFFDQKSGYRWKIFSDLAGIERIFRVELQ